MSAKDFKVEIDLGRKEHPVELATNTPRGTNEKPRKFYPTLYIDAIPGLEKLPKEGCVMIKYRRTRMNIETTDNGEDKAGVTLEIQRICIPEDMEEGKTLEDVFAKLKPGETVEGDDYGDDYSEDDNGG